MSNTRSIAEKLDGYSEVPLQATSLEIWEQKYCLRDRDGKDGYLHHVPRLWRLLERAAGHPSLAPLKRWLDTHIPAERRIVPPEGRTA